MLPTELATTGYSDYVHCLYVDNQLFHPVSTDVLVQAGRGGVSGVN